MGCKKCAESKKKTRFQAKKEVMAHYGDEGWEDDEYEEVIERRLDGYCIECSEPFHDSCGMVSRDEDCSCCDNTRDSLNEHGMDAEGGCGCSTMGAETEHERCERRLEIAEGVLYQEDSMYEEYHDAITDAEKSFNTEEPAVQEPDWIPDGDGRAIGQQDFAINLSPLHAETFEASFYPPEKMLPELKSALRATMEALEECDGIDEREIEGLLASHPIIKRYYGAESWRKPKPPNPSHETDCKCDECDPTKGCVCCYPDGAGDCEVKGADTVGTPSPTFNEDITGQDGPSAEPTNQVFNAMRTMAPSTRDVDNARRQLKNSGYGEVIYDRYIVNQQGSSNKFYYTAITEKDGKYYPMGAYGRIGYLGTLFNVAGKKERPMAHFGSMEEAYRQIRGKEVSKINARKPEKRYVDYTLTRDAESLSEIEGPTAEATTGGLHSPSSFAMTWEDGSGQSSASIPPNEIAWAETSGIPTWVKYGAGLALLLAGGSFLNTKMSEQKAADNLVNAINKRKGCCGSSKTVRKDSEFSVGQINPVEVEGQNDVYGAEELHSPQTSANVSQPNWGPQTTYLQNQRSTQKMW
ncbi:MAG: hypothetical protein GY751_06480 [Bacteroidetes bacterium]|nr:hypothetical protein [Bacteroidota bacterium]